jgi:cell division protein FtsB
MEDKSDKVKSPTITPSNKLPVFIGILALLIIVFAGTYILQVRHINKDKQQLSSLNLSNENLKEQTSKLSQQLNTANQTVSSLTQNNSFVSDATCQTAQLKLTWEQTLSGGFAGDGGVFSYQNISSTACTLDGYPGFLALSNTGQIQPDGPITTKSANLGTKANGPIVPTLITLASSDKAYFVVQWGSEMGANSPSACLVPSLIESTPPGGTIPIIEVLSSGGPTLCGVVSISALAPLDDFEFSTFPQ